MFKVGSRDTGFRGVFSEPCQTPKMELFAKIVKVAFFAKNSILDVW